MIADCAFDSCGLQLAVHDFDDVAPLTHPPQGRLEIRHDAPRSWRGLFRQAHALHARSRPIRKACPPWIAFRFRGKRKDAIACIPQDAAVETSEALCSHLLLELAQLVELAFRAELAGDEFARPRPHAVRRSRGQ